MLPKSNHFSGVVANLELWERSEVLFPPLPFIPFPSPPFSPLLSPTLLSSPLSGGNNFNDFPENQLTIDFAFLCKPVWGNATVSPFLLVMISFRGTTFLYKITTPLYRTDTFLRRYVCDSIRRTVCELHSWERIRAFAGYNPAADSVSIPHGM